MASFIGNIKVLLGLETGQFSKGISTARKETSALEGSMNNFAKNMGGMIAGAFATDALINFGKEASELAGKLTGVEAAFSRIDNGHLLDDLRAATKGTVSDLELMQNAVKAENLGLPVEQLGNYFDFARRTAKATGESVDFLVQSIVTGIGRKSPLILDNLGISTVQLNEALKKTPDFATAVGIVIEEKMAKAGDDIDSAAESTAQLNAKWDNAKVKVGGLINKGLVPLQSAFGNVIEGMEGLFESNQSFEQFIGNYTKAWGGVSVEVKSFEEQLTSLVKVFEKLSTEQLRSEKGLRAFAEAMLKMGVSTEEAVKKYKQLIASKQSTNINQPQIRTIALIEEEIRLQNELIKGVSNRAGAIVIQERIKKLEKEKEAILGNNKALKEQNKLLELKKGLDFSVSSVAFKGLKIEEKDLPAMQLMNGVDKLPSLFDMAMSKLESRVEFMKGKMQEVAQSIKSFFETIAIEGLATFGAALGTAFAGGDVMQVGMQFAQVIADSIGALGKQLIAIGVTMTGIIQAISTAGWANPALVIGGGIALVALSSAMKGMMAQPTMFANGGLVTGATLGMVGEGIGTTRSNPEVIAPLDKLRNFMPDSGGSSGNVNFRIEGNTLVGILDRQGKTSRYTR